MIDFTPRPDIALPIRGKGYDPAAYGDHYKAVYFADYPQIFSDIANGVVPAQGMYRMLAREDLFFVAYFLMENPLMNHPFCVKVSQMVQEGSKTKTLDVWARGHMKSWLLTQAETIQCILKDPEMTHVIFSYKKPKAEDFLSSIKRTLEKPLLTQLFPDILYENPDREAESWSIQNGLIVKRKGASRKEKTLESYGVIEGMPTGGHWDRRVYDDIETADLAKNPEQLEVLIDMFEMSRNLGSPGGIERIIGTYYSHCGLLVHLRDKKTIHGEPVYETRIIPATDDGTASGKPVFLSQSDLDDLKADRSFNSQQLCNPTPLADIKLNSSLFRQIEHKLIPKDVVKFMVIDQAGDDSTNKGKGDSWAFGVFAVKPEIDELGASNVYLVDVGGGQMSIGEAINSITQMYLRNGMIMQVGVEKVALSTTEIHICDALRAYGRRLSVEDRNLVLLRPAGRVKTQRIESALSWPLMNSKLYYSSNIDQVYIDKIKKEFDNFPYFHVDYIDMMAYLYDLLKEFEFGMEGEEEDYEDYPHSHLSVVSGRSRVTGY